MTGFSSLTGRLLVAMPGIDDDRFRQAVILVCAHDEEHAMGLRLDQPVPGVSLSEILEKMEAHSVDSDHNRPVLLGGPVERERGFVLHTGDWNLEDVTVAISADLSLTATRDALMVMSDPHRGPRRAKLMLGYAGWDEGQLEEELTENVWLTADATADLIFDEAYDTKWARALAGLGVDAARLSAHGGRA